MVQAAELFSRDVDQPAHASLTEWRGSRDGDSDISPQRHEGHEGFGNYYISISYFVLFATSWLSVCFDFDCASAVKTASEDPKWPAL